MAPDLSRQRRQIRHFSRRQLTPMSAYMLPQASRAKVLPAIRAETVALGNVPAFMASGHNVAGLDPLLGSLFGGWLLHLLRRRSARRSGGVCGIRHARAYGNQLTAMCATQYAFSSHVWHTACTDPSHLRKAQSSSLTAIVHLKSWHPSGCWAHSRWLRHAGSEAAWTGRQLQNRSILHPIHAVHELLGTDGNHLVA